MNGYDVLVSRVIKGNYKPKSNGYVIVTEDEEVFLIDKVPDDSNVISLSSMEESLYKSCLDIVSKFAESNDNRDVYALSVYADEHRSFLLYLNTIEGLERTIANSKSYSAYTDEKKQELKYSLGDFDFIYETFNEDFEEMYKGYQCVNEALYDVEHVKDLPQGEVDNNTAQFIFNSEIFEEGNYLIALNVTKRLAKHGVEKLNRTDDFILFASSGNDYIDYSLTMRLTIDSKLFGKVFPEMMEHDLEFEKSKLKQLSKPYLEQLAFWYKAISKDRSYESGSLLPKTIRTDYQAIESLSENGPSIIPTLLAELLKAIDNEDGTKIYFCCEILNEFTSFDVQSVDTIKDIAKIASEHIEDEYRLFEIEQTKNYMIQHADQV